MVIRVDDNLLKYLRVVREGKTLRTGLKPGRAHSIREANLEAEVAMRELAGLDLSGGSDA